MEGRDMKSKSVLMGVWLVAIVLAYLTGMAQGGDATPTATHDPSLCAEDGCFSTVGDMKDALAEAHMDLTHTRNLLDLMGIDERATATDETIGVAVDCSLESVVCYGGE